MKHLLFLFFMGFSIIGFSQTQAQQGTKGGCNDAGSETARKSIMNNPSISQEYKDAYLMAWLACTYQGCWVENFVILCDSGLPGPGTSPRPKDQDFPPGDGGHQ